MIPARLIFWRPENKPVEEFSYVFFDAFSEEDLQTWGGGYSPYIMLVPKHTGCDALQQTQSSETMCWGHGKHRSGSGRAVD